MHRTILASLALAALMAGCAGPAVTSDAGPVGSEAPNQMSIVGLVLDETLAPVSGAEVTVRMTELAATTGADGAFRFDGLALSPYLVDVQAAGFENATLTAEPEEIASLEFVLAVAISLRPSHQTVQFHGKLECALEVLIISPSCDSLLTYPSVGGPALFDSVATFEQTVARTWRSVVVDVDFDPEASPGLAGLRVAARGRDDANNTGSYEQFGRFYAPGPFTFRLEPGQTYEEGVKVPENATLFNLEVYPHSHGYHPACVPVANVCPLGVGFATNVVFDLYVTVFLNEPAPAGWSFLTQSPA